MEGVLIEHFNKLKPSTIPMAQFHSFTYDEIFQDARNIVTYIYILLQFILTKQMIAPFLTTMWDHTCGCANHYHCASAIYLLSCLDFLLTE